MTEHRGVFLGVDRLLCPTPEDINQAEKEFRDKFGVSFECAKDVESRYRQDRKRAINKLVDGLQLATRVGRGASQIVVYHSEKAGVRSILISIYCRPEFERFRPYRIQPLIYRFTLSSRVPSLPIRAQKLLKIQRPQCLSYKDLLASDSEFKEYAPGTLKWDEIEISCRMDEMELVIPIVIGVALGEVKSHLILDCSLSGSTHDNIWTKRGRETLNNWYKYRDICMWEFNNHRMVCSIMES